MGRPTDAQRREALGLLRYSFPGTAESRWAELSRGEMMVSVIDAAVVAAVCWRRETVRLAGQAVGCMVAGPGATAPHARRQRLLADAMRTVVRAWRDEGGAPLSGLETPVSRWHRRNGWGPASTLQRVVCQPADLDMPGPDHVDRRDEVGDPRTRTAVRTVHTARAARSTGLLERSDRAWANMLDGPDSEVAVCRDSEGEPTGYVLYRLDRAGGRTTLHIREMLAVQPAGWRSLLRFLARHFEVAQIVWPAPDGFPIAGMVAEPARLEVSLHPDKMVRIVDIAALAEYLSPVPAPAPFVMDVHDDLAPWNAGRWRIGSSGTGVRIDRADDTEEADVSLSVDVLASLLFGRLTPTEVEECGLVEAHSESSYDALCAFVQPFGKAYCPDEW